MANRICNLLQIKYPIIQGPMAWISMSSLVAAISEAGGLGVLGVGFAPADLVKAEIRKTKALTQKPFGANVQLIPEDLEKISPILIEEKIAVVYADTLGPFDVELSRKYYDNWHQHGLKVITKVTSVQEALLAERAGSDAIVLKGWEGGGHVSLTSTMVIIPLAALNISVPVIASGGIGSGRGMAAALVLGADGIELGTAFMLADECPVHPNVKKAMIAAEELDTVVIGMPTGEPCRQIKNRLSDRIVKIEAENTKEAAAEKLKPIVESSLKKAMLYGDVDHEGAVMAGQIVGLLTETNSAAQIMQEILTGCAEALKGNPARNPSI